MKKIFFIIAICLIAGSLSAQQAMMMYGDTSRIGRPYSKDPHVVKFGGRYIMYYSVPPYQNNPASGWNIGIAESHDLQNWNKIGEILPGPDAPYEQKGLCAPGALVRDNKVHLFYQTYGNGKNDAICHAVSTDGITFTRNPTNPIFRPTGDWNCGRAIDAEVIEFKNKYFLYFATRDPEFKTQLLGVATAPKNTNFNREEWTQAADYSILYPELNWEKNCIEAASVIQKYNKLYMFYAGGYNNEPQQVGVAVSEDGIKWTRLSDTPLLANGKEGEWNSSESGHPHAFVDSNGSTYLFYQGNNNVGHNWYISNVRIDFKNKKPYIYGVKQ